LTPLRLAIDLQALQVAGFADRGIGRYSVAFATAMNRIGRVAAGLLATELPPPAGLPGELAVAGLVRWDTPAEVRRLVAQGPLAHHVLAPFLHCGPLDADELVVSSHWAEAGLPRVSTVYDLIPLRAPGHYLAGAGMEERYRARAAWVAGSDLVLAISDHVRREVLEVLGMDPRRVVTVGTGVTPFFTPPDGTDNELFRFHLARLEGRAFVVTVGGSDTRKNTERLVAAVGRLVRQGWDLQLLVVGDLDEHWRRRLTETGRTAWLGDRLVLAGRIGDDLLRACYRRAQVLVMPSLAEGFGLPVLEAAACGCPALASATSALAEAAATPMAVFDPTSMEAIAAAIARVLGDNAHRAAIIEAQTALVGRSSWAAVAERTAGALDRLAENPGGVIGALPKRPPRLALVGPVPPLGGGLGSYAGRLLGAFSGLARVDAVTTMLNCPALPPGVGHVPADAFGPSARPASYDRIVYTLGNSDGHLATVELALRYPGWLWLHEVRLPALATTALEGLDDDAFERAMAWVLERSYPGRAPLEAARAAGRSTLELINAGVGLTPLLVTRSRGVLVNSQAAKHLLLLDLPPLSGHPPIHVLPPACPPLEPSARTSAATGEPVVVVLGVVSMSKRPDVLVDAVALAVATRPCRLVFVGPCPPSLEQMIGDRSRARGIPDRVEVIGPVDADGWREWCERAAVAVQLRDTSSGESSAAVLEALARGLPVVTNLASAAEYPEGTTALIPSWQPEIVASRLVDLLGDPKAQHGLVAAGLAFARHHQFEHLAEAMLAATGPSPNSDSPVP
jgi:glycosyltransferase involved in cell wall biosynthesis